jgi:hypothetical protein
VVGHDSTVFDDDAATTYSAHVVELLVPDDDVGHISYDEDVDASISHPLELDVVLY